jgi:hypothetical protein
MDNERTPTESNEYVAVGVLMMLWALAGKMGLSLHALHTLDQGAALMQKNRTHFAPWV